MLQLQSSSSMAPFSGRGVDLMTSQSHGQLQDSLRALEIEMKLHMGGWLPSICLLKAWILSVGAGVSPTAELRLGDAYIWHARNLSCFTLVPADKGHKDKAMKMARGIERVTKMKHKGEKTTQAVSEPTTPGPWVWVTNRREHHILGLYSDHFHMYPRRLPSLDPELNCHPGIRTIEPLLKSINRWKWGGVLYYQDKLGIWLIYTADIM
jgi:hypothetical protein